MTRRIATALLLSALILGAKTTAAQQQNPNPGSSSTEPVSSSRPAHTLNPPPMPPDVVAPDLPAPDATQDGNPVTRTLKRLAPNCINGIFHACWSSPPQKPQPPMTDVRRGAESREIGEFYFDRGNYHAAESRLREALQFNSNDAKAMFELAESLEKMNRGNEAISEYQACADLQPAGPYAERSRTAIQRLKPSAASAPHF